MFSVVKGHQVRLHPSNQSKLLSMICAAKSLVFFHHNFKDLKLLNRTKVSTLLGGRKQCGCM